MAIIGIVLYCSNDANPIPKRKPTGYLTSVSSMNGSYADGWEPYLSIGKQQDRLYNRIMSSDFIVVYHHKQKLFF